MEATKLDTDGNIAMFLDLLKQAFEPEFEVYANYSVYGPLKSIKLFKASNDSPETYKSQLLAVKTPEGKNRFEAVVIAWRLGGFDMTQYEEHITVHTFMPILQDGQAQFKWDHENTFKVHTYNCLQKTIDESTMQKIISHIKSKVK